MLPRTRVQRFHLEAAPVRPDRRRRWLPREQVGDLVRLDAVVERADLVAELVRDVDHLRHLVGAVAVVVDEDVAAQHLGERLEPEVARRRIALVVGVPLVPLAAVLARPRSTPRDSRRRCPCASTGRASRRRASGFSPHAIFSPYFAPGNFIPCTVRDGNDLEHDAASADQIRRAGKHLERRDAAGEVARELRILRPHRVLGPHVRR